jgi:hypothetical protein
MEKRRTAGSSMAYHAVGVARSFSHLTGLTKRRLRCRDIWTCRPGLQDSSTASLPWSVWHGLTGWPASDPAGELERRRRGQGGGVRGEAETKSEKHIEDVRGRRTPTNPCHQTTTLARLLTTPAAIICLASKRSNEHTTHLK